MDIFETVKRLDFPLGQYVVVGSGIMAAYGLKEAEDIDIVVTEDLFEQLRLSGEWGAHTTPDGKLALRRDDAVEVFLDVNCGNHNPSTRWLIDNAEVIDGVPFIPLEELVKFKREYGRPKDWEHIRIIEEYWSRIERG